MATDTEIAKNRQQRAGISLNFAHCCLLLEYQEKTNEKTFSINSNFNTGFCGL